MARAVEPSKPDPQERYLLLAAERTSTMQKELDKAASTGHRILVGSPTSGTEIMMLLEKVARPNAYQYKLLATKRLSTLQKELNEAAGAGYRIIGSSPTSGNEMVVILEKVATPPQTYEYLLLATTRTSTMQKELSEAAAKGFRLMPKSIIAKQQMLAGIEIVMLLEKAPASQQRYKYLLLATSRTSTMQKEMGQATDEGYQVVGMASRGEHVVIMEKPEGGG